MQNYSKIVQNGRQNAQKSRSNSISNPKQRSFSLTQGNFKKKRCSQESETPKSTSPVKIKLEGRPIERGPLVESLILKIKINDYSLATSHVLVINNEVKFESLETLIGELLVDH